MIKALIVLLSATALLLSYPIGKKVVDTIRSNGMTKEVDNPNSSILQLPNLPNLLSQDPPKSTSVKRTVTLEAKNTVTFRGPVLPGTVAKAMREISSMSRNLSKSDTIYLVMDTPGGSIFDGADFIDFLEGIPQKITTVTIFAASMGFHIVESNPGERLITRSGVLMSHRAKGGVEGQFDGELESEYKMVKREIDYLEVTAAKRVGMNIQDYKAKIVNEWWVHGFDANTEKVADDMVLIQCGSTLTGTESLSIGTIFGVLLVTFDRCPLFREPISIDLAGIAPNAKDYVMSVQNELFRDQEKFTKDFILTEKFKHTFKYAY